MACLQARTAMGALAAMVAASSWRPPSASGLRIDSVDQADAQGLVSLDILGGVQQLLGHAGGDQPGQTLVPPKPG